MDEQSLHNIGLLRNELEHADRILVGAGAGLSASAGLSYLDEAVFREHFPEEFIFAEKLIGSPFCYVKSG